LVKGNAPYAPPTGQRLSVALFAIEVVDSEGKPVASVEPYAAVFNPDDSTFTVPGPEGRGVPPGKYRIAITQKWKRESMPDAKPGDRNVFDRDTDILKDKFSEGDSPIIREIKSAAELTIDLDNPIERVAAK
jgi:hypothetical protein